MKIHSKQKNERNYGIDLLRIIAMIYVVILHTLGSGGILNALEVNTHKYIISWALEIFAFCAVDVFALITGYISYREKKRSNIVKNYIMLWLEVVFYCLIITICFNIFVPSMVTKKTYLYSFLPVLTNQYWYFTAYFGLVLFMPIIDNGLRKTTKKDLKKIFIILIIVYTFIAIIKDKFGINGGYTVIWLLILYILGGIIKKCDLFNKIKSRYIILIMILSYMSSLLYITFSKNIVIADINLTSIFSVSYLSPTILIISIGYLIIFSRMKYKDIYIKIIKFFSPTTFAIYLLNSNHLIEDYFLKDKLIFLSNYRTIKMILIVVFGSITFSIIAMLIDKIRILLFEKIKINKLSEKITYIYEITTNKIIKKI